MTKLWQLQNSNCDKTQKLKLWEKKKVQNVNCQTKTKIVSKLENSNCDKSQKLKLWQNSTTQIVTKPKKINCDKTKKKSNSDKTKKSNCDGSYGDSSSKSDNF